MYWAESESLLEIDTILVSPSDGEARWFEIQRAGRTAKGTLLKLAGVDDYAAAQGLRGATLSARREQLPQLEEGEFYLCDLVGAAVTVAGAAFGEVVEVRTHPTLDTIVIRTLEGALVEQPLKPPWLLRVDTEAGEVELANADGVIA